MVNISRSQDAAPVWIVDVDGRQVDLRTIIQNAVERGGSSSDIDTDGNPVPTYKAHTYTYDTSGNLETDTVSDDTGTWVRTYSYDDGVQTADSGWVKQ